MGVLNLQVLEMASKGGKFECASIGKMETASNDVRVKSASN